MLRNSSADYFPQIRASARCLNQVRMIASTTTASRRARSRTSQVAQRGGANRSSWPPRRLGPRAAGVRDRRHDRLVDALAPITLNATETRDGEDHANTVPGAGQQEALHRQRRGAHRSPPERAPTDSTTQTRRSPRRRPRRAAHTWRAKPPWLDAARNWLAQSPAPSAVPLRAIAQPLPSSA
jgi:hypothetical protein